MGTLFLPLSGSPPGSPTPSNQIEVRFAVGDAGASLGPKNVLILAPSLAAGDIVQDTQVFGPVADEDDVIARTGAGSAAHLTWAAYKANGGTAPTYLLCPTRSAGVAASGTMTLTGTPTGRGTVEVILPSVSRQSAFYTFDVGDTPTTIAAGLVTAINALTRNPILASNVAGVLTLTARQAGLGGNTLRFRATSTGQGISVGSASSEAALAGGTVAENHTAALAAIAGRRFALIVVATSDATEMGKIKTHVNTLALPATGLRQVACFGLSLTPSAASTAVQTLNMERGEFFSQEECPNPSYVLAGKGAGALVSAYFVNPSANLDGYGTKAGQVFTCEKPTNASALPNASELDLMLNSGVTPIGIAPNDQAYIVRSVTGRSLNGAVPDYRVRDAHRVWVADAMADDIVTKLASQPWEKLSDDLTDPNALPLDAIFATPQRAKTQIQIVVRDFLARGHLDPGKTAKMLSDLQVGIDPQDPGALNIKQPVFAANLLHKTRTLLAESSPNA
jgi:phage tail sheath gpL-like